MLKTWLLILAIAGSLPGLGQRTYRPSSVLASGNWFKIAVTRTGIYQVNRALLNSLGVGTGSISSSSIRLYGNGGRMLPENCSGNIPDDLQENALQMVDGGDGIFDGSDYFLFFAPGPDSWLADTVNQSFVHQKNLYTDRCFYFITFGGAGKRIQVLSNNSPAGETITSFDEHYFRELDSTNFLSSGKNWYGEEFANAPGKLASHTFSIPLTNLIAEPATLISSCISRSVSGSSRLTVKLNDLQLLQHEFDATGSSNLDLFARTSRVRMTFVPSSPAISIRYDFQAPAGAQGWLDWFEIVARRSLDMTALDQLLFRDWKSVGAGNTGEFILKGGSPTIRVWDVSDPLMPAQMKTLVSGNELKFVNDCSTLHEYIAFNNTGFLTPSPIGKIANQDLHNFSPAALIIITHSSLFEQARRLADHHIRHDNMKALVVTTEQVYNEFASGSADPTAIRDFVKMYYDKAGNDTAKRPRYLLLFGDASFDYKDRLKNNTNLVPSFQSLSSVDPLATYTSDDYFGFLDDNEDITSASVTNVLDVGIGRIPAKTAKEARDYVEKVVHYTSPKGLGAWRNQLTFVADDEDFNLHLQDAEIITSAADAANPLFLQDKVYLDAYQQESNSSGSRYPAANLAINNSVEKGTLIWNYNGHGGFRRLAEEVILDEDIVNSWNNTDRLPLIITATCDFAPYDNPAIYSLGENILLKEKAGAIALMTTTRLVFAFSNRIINRNYLQAALSPKADGTYLSLGEAVREAKNITYQTSGDIINNRKFTLLGDPALTIAFPTFKVVTSTINNVQVTGVPDTLKALQEYKIAGMITDNAGHVLNDFNGTVYTTVYDKVNTFKTLGNDPESLQENVQVQNNTLFNGKADVKNGHFSFSFIVPKDINYQFGNGKISYYAENGQNDGNGSFTNLIIGGSQGLAADFEGPQIKAFLNDESFVSGSITNEVPVLLLKLSDSSGINIVGTGIGHDITAVLDGNVNQVFVLNEFFETELNSYRNGTLRFRLPKLPEGAHTLTIKAWDIANNSTEVSIEFIVKNKQFSILRLINYPNPVTSKTIFRLEHDLEVNTAQVSIQVFTVGGRLVKWIQHTINTSGNRSSEIEWDGKNDYGVHIQPGIYMYLVTLTTSGNLKARKAGKFIKL